jgi:hypothetical protein
MLGYWRTSDRPIRSLSAMLELSIGNCSFQEDADPGISILKEAKAEYAKLK